MVGDTGTGEYAALVIGATGSVGAHLVNALLRSLRCTQLTVVTRAEVEAEDKLRAVIWADFDDVLIRHPEQAVAAFEGHDVVFCCLGASEKQMMGLLFRPKKYEPIFRVVDHDYVVAAASAADRAGVSYFSVISSPTADVDARFSYSRIKGEMEREVKAIGFDRLSIFQPGNLVPVAAPRGSGTTRPRAWRRWVSAVLRSNRVDEIAASMLVEYELYRASERDPVSVYGRDEILELASQASP